MSRTLSLISPAGQYASPNQLVTAQIATNVGFNANDYVYAYGNNQVGNLGSTIGLGAVSTFIAGTKISGAIASGFAPTAVMAGPYSATGLYTAATRTQGDVFQVTTDVTTMTASGARQCVLNNGNLAVLFLDNINAYLYICVITPSGTIIKTPTFVSAQGGLNLNTSSSISAMADGGFIVVFSTTSDCRYVRFNSVGNVLVNQTVLNGNFASSQQFLTAAGVKGGGWMVVGHGGNAQMFVQSYSSTNSYVGQISVTNASQSYWNSIVALSNGNCAVCGNFANTTLNYAIITPSLVEVKTFTGLYSNGSPISMAAYDTGFVVATRNNNGFGTLSSVSNDGTILKNNLQSNVSVPGNTGDVNVCVSAENNVVNMMAKNNSNQWFIQKYTSINSSSMALGTLIGLTYSLTYSNSIDTFFNALNGSLCHVSLNSNKPAITTFNQDTYTQNTTVLTNQGLYTPPNGYYFLGIAATTAAANSSGLVYTNGGIALPSTYPSVTTGYAFDYQGSGLWAQRGTINGRAINLQGAQ